MPIPQGHVIELIQQGSIEIQAVVGAAGVVVIGVEIGRCEAMHRAMGEQDPGVISRQLLPIEVPHPVGGITAIAAAQQRAWQHHGAFHHHGPALKQHVQVGGAPLLFALKEGAVPHAARRTMVVVAGNHQHRDRQLADGLAHRRYVAAAGGRGIKQIASHQEEGGLLLIKQRTNAADGVDPGLAQAGPFVGVVHAGVGLADLPVGTVQKGEHQRSGRRTHFSVPVGSAD